MSSSIFQVRLREGSALPRVTQQEMRWRGVLSPGACHQPIPQRSALCLGYHKARVARGILQAEAAQRRTLCRELLPATRESCLRLGGGPGAADPRSQVTGWHHWGVQFPRGLSHLQPGSSQPRKTVTWGESWALQKRAWARDNSEPAGSALHLCTLGTRLGPEEGAAQPPPPLHTALSHWFPSCSEVLF